MFDLNISVCGDYVRIKDYFIYIKNIRYFHYVSCPWCADHLLIRLMNNEKIRIYGFGYSCYVNLLEQFYYLKKK